MNVILFGATGMVGRGVLREALGATDVASVLVVGRTAVGVTHPKLREILRSAPDAFTEDEARGVDACFFCLGTPSAGKSEAEYSAVTYDLTLRVAERLRRVNPNLTFVYVSGAGADSSESGSVMWARVRGRVENALLRMFPHGYVFRPGAIQAVNGERSKVLLYRLSYGPFAWFFPLLRLVLPNAVTTTEVIGRAMLTVARSGAPKKILSAADFRELGT